MIGELARPGDMVVCLGAGSITGWANSLPGELAALHSPEPRRMSGAAVDCGSLLARCRRCAAG